MRGIQASACTTCSSEFRQNRFFCLFSVLHRVCAGQLAFFYVTCDCPNPVLMSNFLCCCLSSFSPPMQRVVIPESPWPLVMLLLFIHSPTECKRDTINFKYHLFASIFSTRCVVEKISFFRISFYLRCTFNCSCIDFVFPIVRNILVEYRS